LNIVNRLSVHEVENKLFVGAVEYVGTCALVLFCFTDSVCTCSTCTRLTRRQFVTRGIPYVITDVQTFFPHADVPNSSKRSLCR
jgi:hypothetical protein